MGHKTEKTLSALHKLELKALHDYEETDARGHFSKGYFAGKHRAYVKAQELIRNGGKDDA